MFYDMKILFIGGDVLDKYRQVKFGLKYKKKTLLFTAKSQKNKFVPHVVMWIPAIGVNFINLV